MSAMSEDPKPKPKLIVDEDWKTQVQREKEALKKPSDADSTSPDDAATETQPRRDKAGALPPASISLLTTMLATQAMAALGVLHDPSLAEPQVEPELAKHFIDLLGVLEEKTQGNLSQEESSLLSQTLHELRMMYVTLGN